MSALAAPSRDKMINKIADQLQRVDTMDRQTLLSILLESGAEREAFTQKNTGVEVNCEYLDDDQVRIMHQYLDRCIEKHKISAK